GRPGGGGRRLRDEAVQPRGAGGKGPRSPAPGASRPRPRAAPLRRPPPRRGHPRGVAGGHPDRPHCDRVPAAARPAREPAARALQGPAPGAGLAGRLRRPQRRRDLHQLSPKEDRPDGTPADPHGAGSRVLAEVGAVDVLSIRARVLAATLGLVLVGLVASAGAIYGALQWVLVTHL